MKRFPKGYIPTNKYRCKIKCDNDKCGKTYTTIKRPMDTAPARCKYCGSWKTRVLDSWKVK